MAEIRKHIVSGDWIIIAPERAKRPEAFLQKKKVRERAPKKSCSFEHLETSGNWPPMLQIPKTGEWHAVIIPNKYPVLPHRDVCAVPTRNGPYEALTAVGSHELLVTRDHDKSIADLTLDEGVAVFELLQERYRMLAKDPCLFYTSTFFNWGPLAGATVYHPHYQIVSLPIIPPHVAHSLRGSDAYFNAHKKCPHCVVISYEHKEKKRVIAENGGAIAITPYASREPFEVGIYPKRHEPSFEYASRSDLRGVVALLQTSMQRIRKYLNDPDLNFMLHTAPLKHRKNYHHYHWHIAIVPHMHINAGFEFSTHVQVNMIDPDVAARMLRRGK